MKDARRGRQTAAEWSKVIAQWRASGETSKIFAARHGLNPGTLLWWSARLPKEGARSKRAKPRVREPAFAEVRVRSGAVEVSAGRVEVVTRSGRVVRIEGAVDPRTLRAVIEAVESC
jgi:hypothetical protein